MPRSTPRWASTKAGAPSSTSSSSTSKPAEHDPRIKHTNHINTKGTTDIRKIINFTHATLDGYIDNPYEWSSEYSTDEKQEYLTAMHLGADALLLGRVTYEGMAQAWPNMGGNPFADHVNSITKYVVATEPVDTTAWNPTVVIAGSDLLDEVRQLKQTDGGDIIIWGAGQLTDALSAAGLLDEYRISTSPVIKGDGEPMFRPASVGTVELLDTRTFTSGAVLHTYHPTPA